MGHDDFDDAPSPDEQGEDFANFDPETYLRRRNTGRYGDSPDSGEDSQPLETDAFSTFDPGQYLQKRYQGRSYLNPSSQGQQAAYTGRSRWGRRSDRDRDREIGRERPGCLARLFGFGETVGLLQQILVEGGPIIRIIGCVLILAIGAICAGAVLVLNAITQHP